MVRSLAQRKGWAIIQFAGLCALNTAAALALAEWSSRKDFVTLLVDSPLVLYSLTCIYLLIRWWPLITSFGSKAGE